MLRANGKYLQFPPPSIYGRGWRLHPSAVLKNQSVSSKQTATIAPQCVVWTAREASSTKGGIESCERSPIRSWHRKRPSKVLKQYLYFTASCIRTSGESAWLLRQQHQATLRSPQCSQWFAQPPTAANRKDWSSRTLALTPHTLMLKKKQLAPRQSLKKETYLRTLISETRSPAWLYWTASCVLLLTSIFSGQAEVTGMTGPSPFSSTTMEQRNCLYLWSHSQASRLGSFGGGSNGWIRSCGLETGMELKSEMLLQGIVGNKWLYSKQLRIKRTVSSGEWERLDELVSWKYCTAELVEVIGME